MTDGWTEIGPGEVTVEGRTHYASSIKFGPVCEFDWTRWENSYQSGWDGRTPRPDRRPVDARGDAVAFWYHCGTCHSCHWTVPAFETHGTAVDSSDVCIQVAKAAEACGWANSMTLGYEGLQRLCNEYERKTGEAEARVRLLEERLREAQQEFFSRPLVDMRNQIDDQGDDR